MKEVQDETSENMDTENNENNVQDLTYYPNLRRYRGISKERCSILVTIYSLMLFDVTQSWKVAMNSKTLEQWF